MKSRLKLKDDKVVCWYAYNKLYLTFYTGKLNEVLKDRIRESDMYDYDVYVLT